MSSSAKFPGWDQFKERELPAGAIALEGLLAPALELAASLQRQSAASLEAQQQASTERQFYLEALAQQAMLVFELAGVLERNAADLPQEVQKRFHRPLRIVKEKMLEALGQAGIVIENPLGRPYHEVADLVRIQGWSHDQQFDREQVAKVHEPLITCRGELLRQALVIMGAPPLPDVAANGSDPSDGAGLQQDDNDRPQHFS